MRAWHEAARAHPRGVQRHQQCTAWWNCDSGHEKTAAKPVLMGTRKPRCLTLSTRAAPSRISVQKNDQAGKEPPASPPSLLFVQLDGDAGAHKWAPTKRGRRLRSGKRAKQGTALPPKLWRVGRQGGAKRPRLLLCVSLVLLCRGTLVYTHLDGGAASSGSTVQAVVTVLPEVIVGDRARSAKHVVAGGTPPQRRTGLLWLAV